MLPRLDCNAAKELVRTSTACAKGIGRSIAKLTAQSDRGAGRSTFTATSSSNRLRVGRFTTSHAGILGGVDFRRPSSASPTGSSGEAGAVPNDPHQQDEAAHRVPTESVRRIAKSECMRGGVERQQLTDCLGSRTQQAVLCADMDGG